jgi:pimeloyl-ACP methyl ester carboxylesterase
VIGYSGGGYVAIRALELLPADVRVAAAATLAGAYDPRRDLTGACEHIAGKLVVCSSMCDFFIVGLGTLLLGTCDGRHVLSAGMVGLKGPAARDPRIVQVRWRPSMIRTGNLGEHFTAAARGFIRDHVAGHLGIGSE